MPDTPRDRPHIYLQGGGQPLPYTRRGGGGVSPLLRDRAQHVARLEGELAAAAQAAVQARQADLRLGSQGTYIEVQFSSREAAQQLFERLDSSGLSLAAVHHNQESGAIYATVAVPDTALAKLTQTITDYRDRQTKKGNPKNARLVSNVETIRHAALKSIFVGDLRKLPKAAVRIWWEVWLQQGGRDEFQQLAQRCEVRVSERTLSFPDRDIVLVEGTFDGLSQIFVNSLVMRELRLSLDTPTVFTDMPNNEQVEWVQDTSARQRPPLSDAKTSILILDSGINRQHPLISPYLHPDDWQAWNAAWGPADMWKWKGHGTAMAGLALHGDLETLLRSTAPIEHRHVLESVKILPPIGVNSREQYAVITRDAVNIMESIRPGRWRIVCLAVTADQDKLQGRPTAWSAELDQLAAGEDNEDGTQRLIVVAAGNCYPTPADIAGHYLDFTDTSEVHSPAQAWNALTVGAFTERTNLIDAKYAHWSVVAPAGDLSPTSSTSLMWQDQWPLKPDVVFEGGNLIADSSTVDAHSDVRVLTTHYNLSTAHFEDFGDTSAAAALASNMAAQLAVDHPEYWPETVRGLIAHSAEWTDAMKRHKSSSSVHSNRLLLRRYGHGVPSLERALRSASNDLTLVVQDSLRPFKQVEGSPKNNEMNWHVLPWHALDLSELQGIELEMRVTLSYFIEPNPSERGFSKRFRYASHGLRFAVKGALESDETFKARIQNESRTDDEEGIRDAGNTYWELGPTLRRSGSLHVDRWRGDIATLQRCDKILICPVSGWWREKKGGEPAYWSRKARYALIVSLRAPDTAVDIYTPITTALTVPNVIDL